MVSNRVAVRAGWAEARPRLAAIAQLLQAGRWDDLDREAVLLGGQALDLGIAAAQLPQPIARRVDGVVGALLRASDLATRAAAVRPDDPEELAAALSLVDVDAVRARRMWAGVEMALDRAPRTHLRAV